MPKSTTQSLLSCIHGKKMTTYNSTNRPTRLQKLAITRPPSWS